MTMKEKKYLLRKLGFNTNEYKSDWTIQNNSTDLFFWLVKIQIKYRKWDWL